MKFTKCSGLGHFRRHIWVHQVFSLKSDVHFDGLGIHRNVTRSIVDIPMTFGWVTERRRSKHFSPKPCCLRYRSTRREFTCVGRGC